MMGEWLAVGWLIDVNVFLYQYASPCWFIFGAGAGVGRAGVG